METNGEVQLMYFLFRYKNMRPMEYIQMGMNERLITKIFMYQELEDRKKEIENLKGAG